MKKKAGLNFEVGAVRELRFTGTLPFVDITLWGANWGQRRRTDASSGRGCRMPGIR
jgi:hypothetical protein